MKTPETAHYLTAHFSGHVQGVGFRYSTSQVARGYEVTGYVKNLMDGRVELEVEGEEAECQSFLEAVKDELDAYIRKTEVVSGARPRKFDRFRIA